MASADSILWIAVCCSSIATAWGHDTPDHRNVTKHPDRAHSLRIHDYGSGAIRSPPDSMLAHLFPRSHEQLFWEKPRHDKTPLLDQASAEESYLWNFSAGELLAQIGTEDHNAMLQVKDGKEWFRPIFPGEDLADLVASSSSLALSLGNLEMHRDHVLTPLLRDLEEELGSEVAVVAFIARSQGGAFEQHFDLGDTFILQVQGSRVWTICSHDKEFCRELSMSSGSTMFLPAGFYHNVSTSSKIPSIHYTLGLKGPAYQIPPSNGMVQRGDCRDCCYLCCAVCRTEVHEDSVHCNFHGTATQNWHYHNWGTCNNCGGHATGWMCECHHGWTGSTCETKFCDRGEYVDSDECFQCDQGKYLPDDGHQETKCIDCSPGYYQDRTGQSSCLECPAGSFSTSPQLCVSCPSGKYSPHPLSTGCLECGDNVYCPEGVSEPLSCNSAPSCPSELYGSCGTCQSCTQCGESEYQVTDCTETEDRRCSSCTACGESEYQVTDCTEAEDRRCSSCTACGESEYQVTDCTETEDRRCSSCTECGESEHQINPCSVTADRTCGDCNSEDQACSHGMIRQGCGSGSIGRCVESPLNADADSGDSQRVLQEFPIDVLAGVLGGVGAAAITGFTAWYVPRRC